MTYMRNAYNMLVGKAEGKPLGRLRHRREDNIRMHFREIVWEGVNWMHLAQDTDQWWVVLNKVMTFGLRKRRGISRVDEGFLASQDGLCSMKFVTSILHGSTLLTECSDGKPDNNW
jgi:hypothetical protein